MTADREAGFPVRKCPKCGQVAISHCPVTKFRTRACDLVKCDRCGYGTPDARLWAPKAVMSAPSDPTVFHAEEVSVMIAICSGLDPTRYADPETQQVIRHCIFASAFAGKEGVVGKVIR